MNKSDNSLLAYRRLIQDHLSKPDAPSFNNEGKEHALILMQEIFKFCKSKIKIFAKGLGGKLASDEEYIKAIEGYLEEGGEIEVLVENNTYLNDNSSALNLLSKRSIHNDRISCRVVKEGVVTMINSHFTALDNCNFLVGDGRVTRVEFNPENFKAVANFHDRLRAEKLNKIFDKYFAPEYSQELIIDVA